MLSVTAYSQWEVGDYVDDNGEATGDIFLHQTSLGTFKKGKKKDKNCSFFLEHNVNENEFYITIYPYGKLEEEAWSEDSFQWVIIKQPSGDLRSIEVFCLEGMIFFEGAEYTEFMDVIKEEGSYILTMTHHLKDSTKYKFTFNN